MSITWVDNTTPLNASNMNKLEQTVRKGQPAGYAGLDGAGNLNLGDGKLQFGTGGGANDTQLYRESAQRLITNSVFSASLDLIANAGKPETIWLTNTGKPTILFGSLLDTNLYRDAANVLATDDQFWIKGAAGLKFPDGTTMITAATGGGGALPADTVVAAATRIIANKLLAGDTQPVWRVLGSGQLEWGQGGSTPIDTNLYRSAANQLTTDDAFQAAGNITTSGYFSNARISNGISYQTALVGDSANRFQIDNQGKMQWGSGTALDVFLQRPSASILELDGSTGGLLSIKRSTSTGVALQVQVGAETFSRFYLRRDGKHEWGDGTSVSANLYRQADGVLRMDGKAAVGAFLDLANDTAAMIRFGAAQDVNLQRSDFGGGVIRLRSNKDIASDSNVFATVGGSYAAIGALGPSGESALTLNGESIYRVAAGVLRTGVIFQSLSDVYSRAASNRVMIGTVPAGGGTGLAGVSFGNSAAGGSDDTYLYRIAAGVIRTDGALQAVGNLYVGGQFQTANLNNANTNGTQAGWKMPVYDGSGVLRGYVQLYTG